MVWAMTPASAPTGRRERRKLETRDRLLTAARELIGDTGAAGLRIQDVTERADVGFGTFYTYFETKDALVEAVIADAMTRAATAIGTRALEYDDPAETASISYRRFLRYAEDEPQVAAVLVGLEGAEELFENSLTVFARQTLQRGIDSGRFDIEDLELCLTSVAAAALAGIRGVLSGRISPDADVAGATMMLRGFGLDHASASEIARRPLPAIAV
ncbi:MAG: hypothetical protein QOF76_4823 [Solirubrobacteraceae bacterium]|jgi:AcrR family transcriptional regulator|nr:hypothetical protein [Solirubrobacteraceae bacterium]